MSPKRVLSSSPNCVLRVIGRNLDIIGLIIAIAIAYYLSAN